MNRITKGMNLFSHQKIKDGLSKIKCESDGSWFVPNRKSMNMNFDEFIEFERQRILEFKDKNIVKNKYKNHYGEHDPKEI